MSENYGPLIWSRLVTASRGFFNEPPEGFSTNPILKHRGALFLALNGEEDILKQQADEMLYRGANLEMISPKDALSYCPVIREELFSLALYEPDCKDVDTNELMSGYAKCIKHSRGSIETIARALSIVKSNDLWRITTKNEEYSAPILVNAAGGWAQEIGKIASLSNRYVIPFRRTAVTIDPPHGADVSRWPMTFDVAETFYFKPEIGDIMISPVDMEPSEPCDAQADEMEVAIAIDRIERYTTLDVTRIKHKWGGLRTFASDHEPVIGPDPEDGTFIWLAGQGGNGVMACDASARLAASLAVGDDIPQDIQNLEITAEDVSPSRHAVMQEKTVTVGSLDNILQGE